MTRLVCGFGINDVINSSKTKEYQQWVDMIKRSKSKILKEKRKTYSGVDCSEEWLVFSNFLNDISNMVGYGNSSWQLDKDILFKGNKLYSK